MDTMVVLRAATQHSWTNPAERIMSVLHLGLQGCSLARTAMYNDCELTMRNCNGMSVIRRAAEASQIVANESRKEPDPNQVDPLPTIASSTAVIYVERCEVLVSLAARSMVAEAAFLPMKGV